MDVNNVKSSDLVMKILIFVPLSACTCTYENFLNRVFNVMNPYMKHIDFEVLDIAGKESTKYNIIRETVIVKELIQNPEGDLLNNSEEEPIIFNSISDFKDFIEIKYNNKKS
ncbi:MAG: hypothetical protein GY870_09750 [archaeon]|nr:hypothetical protein [archaeon]